jgi:hypothetical protein
MVKVDENGNLCPQPNSTTNQTMPSTSTGGAGTDTTNPGSATNVLAQAWPAGQAGWTVVLFSLAQADFDRQYANERAAKAQADGVAAGVLDTNGFAGMCPDLWYVFHGIYSTQAEAVAEQARVRQGSNTYQGAFVREVRPTGTPPSCPS